MDYTREQIDALAGELAEAHGIPTTLLLRLIEVESNGNPWAVRYEPTFDRFHTPAPGALKTTWQTERELQRMSWGLCQIMGWTARRLGFTDPLPRLVDPAVNLQLACTYLTQLHDHDSAGHSWRWAITAYNHGEKWEQIEPQWFRNGYTGHFHDTLSALGEA